MVARAKRLQPFIKFNLTGYYFGIRKVRPKG